MPETSEKGKSLRNKKKNHVCGDGGLLSALFCLFPDDGTPGGRPCAALSQLDFYREGMVEWLIYFFSIVVVSLNPGDKLFSTLQSILGSGLWKF